MMTLETLNKFCDPLRATLRTPFNIGEFTYACNGNIAVRVPRIEGATGVGEEKLPSLFDSAKTPDSFVEIDAVEIKTEFLVCNDCAGLGYFKRCKDCEGTGFKACDNCGHEEECETCKGEGQTADKSGEKDCIKCKATGQIIIDQHFLLGGSKFKREYINLISTLPNVKIGAFDKPNYDPVCFTFDGGSGLVMPVRDM